MITQAAFLRDIALELLSTRTDDGIEFLPLSVAAFNLLAADGSYLPLAVGMLCDSRIAANPWLAIDDVFCADCLATPGYIDAATAWGDAQLQFLAAFMPVTKSSAKPVKKAAIHCVRPWQTSLFEKLSPAEYQSDLDEDAEILTGIFDVLENLDNGNGKS